MSRVSVLSLRSAPVLAASVIRAALGAPRNTHRDHRQSTVSYQRIARMAVT